MFMDMIFWKDVNIWGITPCRPTEIHPRFTTLYFLHPQGRNMSLESNHEETDRKKSELCLENRFQMQAYNAHRGNQLE
jgi:hypothetical protein